MDMYTTFDKYDWTWNSTMIEREVLARGRL